MIELSVGVNEAGQRADKLLFKYLNAAPASFVYKMMRKKNIELNGRKMTGKEILAVGDKVTIWFSDETLAKFHTSYGQEGALVAGGGSGQKTENDAGEISGRVREHGAGKKSGRGRESAAENAAPQESGSRSSLRTLPVWFRKAVLYEDDQIILVNKPANVLSQRADGDTLSMNEYLIAYLLDEGKISERELDTFRPAFCNRLDRNTTGILAGGKTLAALQELSELFRTRRIRKYYLAIVHGGGMKDMDLCGYLYKDEKSNKVEVLPENAALSLNMGEKGGKKVETENRNRAEKKWERIETSFHVLNEFPFPQIAAFSDSGSVSEACTLLKIHLITGKTHQIRAHLASIDHPIVGDMKYGKKRRSAVCGQLLHSYELDFPEDLEGKLRYLAGRKFFCDPPAEFEKLCGNLKDIMSYV